jgi:hypothetical protein
MMRHLPHDQGRLEFSPVAYPFLASDKSLGVLVLGLLFGIRRLISSCCWDIYGTCPRAGADTQIRAL